MVLIFRFFAVLALASLAAPAIAQQAETRAVGEAARVRPGDRIALKVWMEPELSDTFTVAADGNVVLPKLGTVKASSHSVSALQDSLRQAYAVYLRNPALDVTVLRRIGVHGEVHRPALYWVDLTMTLRDVIAQAGGITPGGDPNKISVVRDGQRIRFENRQGAELVAAELASGDQVSVGSRGWFERNSLAVVSTAAVVFSIVFPIIRDLFEG